MIRRLSLIAFLALFLFSLGGESARAQSLCQPPTINLTRGNTDATTGGQVTRLQRFLLQQEQGSTVLVSGTFDALTESAVKRFQAKYGIANSGSAATTGYGVAGPLTRSVMQRACGSSNAAVGVTAGVDQTPEVQIETVYPGKMTGRYRNLPAGSQIVLTNFYNGSRMSGSGSTLVRSGGDGKFSFEVDGDWNDQTSLFYAQAVAQNNPSRVIARSQQFQDAGPARKNPTCTLTSSSYRVRSGETFKLSWTSKGAKYVWWEGKEYPKRDSLSLTETEPGVHQYSITAQGEPSQALCFAHVTVTGTDRSRPVTVQPAARTKPSGSFGNSSLTAHAENPVISGAAQGVSTVSFFISDSEKLYGSGDIPVINGVWTHRVSTSLANGKYDITLSYYDTAQRKSVALSRKTLTVNVYSEAREVADRPVVVGVYESSSPDGTVTVRLLGDDRTLPQAIVLTAYRTVKWIVENPDDLPVTKIVAIGPRNQGVSAPRGIPVEYHTSGSGLYAYKRDARYNDLISWLKRNFGYTDSGNFYGEYSADYFEVYLGTKA